MAINSGFELALPESRPLPVPEGIIFGRLNANRRIVRISVASSLISQDIIGNQQFGLLKCSLDQDFQDLLHMIRSQILLRLIPN